MEHSAPSRSTADREQAAMGIFVILDKPSRHMQTEATSAGVYHSPGWQRDYPRVQILTVADLLHGAEAQMPSTATTFEQAQRSDTEPEARQGRLLD